MKKSYLYSSLFLFAVLCSTVLAWVFFLTQPVSNQPPGIVFEIHQGTSKKLLLQQLSEQKIITSPWLFALYIYPQFHIQLKTGEYFFSRNATPLSIWKQVTTGTGLYYRPFTIIPGWTFKQLRQALQSTQGLRHNTANLTDEAIMQQLQTNQLPEGNFLPETYFYTKGNADVMLLKQSFQLLQTKFAAAWEKRAANLPYKNAYEALIAASLIEKEAFLSSERPVIAGVLINRLRHNMLLQFDPTIIYGLGDSYNGKIYKSDLTKDTPYNTYLHAGLPPTPIAMPSMSSIEAALHPVKHDFYYFVARGDGSHQFSKSLSEHNAAVVKFSKQMKATSFNNQAVEAKLQAILFSSVPFNQLPL